MTRFVVNATDKNDFYSFYMPIVCHAWKAYIGYEPVAILHGGEDSWRENPKYEFLLNHIRSSARTCFIEDVPGFKVSTVMQVCRLFGHLVPWVGQVDYLMTSDVDMVPLSRDYFWQQDMSYRFNLFGADAYGDITQGAEPAKFPMCYIGAPASHWRDVLGTAGKDLHAAVSSALHGRSDVWENDEMYFAEKLAAHPYCSGPYERVKEGRYRKGECECLVRGWSPYARLRLDRAHWRYSGEPGMIDCHAHRPGYQYSEVLLGILCTYFPASASYYTRYVQDFIALKEKHG